MSRYEVRFVGIVDYDGEIVGFEEGDIYVIVDAENTEEAKLTAKSFLIARLNTAEITAEDED